MKLKLTCIIALGLSLGALHAQTDTDPGQQNNSPTLSNPDSSTNGTNAQIEEPSGADTPRGRAFDETNAPPGRPFSTNNPPEGRPFDDGGVPPGRPFNEGAGAQPVNPNDQQGTEESKPQEQPGQSESGVQQGSPARPE